MEKDHVVKEDQHRVSVTEDLSTQDASDMLRRQQTNCCGEVEDGEDLGCGMRLFINNNHLFFLHVCASQNPKMSA